MWKTISFALLILLVFASCKQPDKKMITETKNSGQDSIAKIIESYYADFSAKIFDADEIMAIYDTMEDKHRLKNKEDELTLALIRHHKGKVAYRKNKMKAIDYFLEAIELRKKWLPESHEDLARAYQNLGLIYYKLYDYYKALDYSLRAAKYPEQLPLDLRINIYKSLALLYKNTGDLDHARTYLISALSLAEYGIEINKGKAKTGWEKTTASLKNDLAVLLANHLKDPEEALPHILNAIKLQETECENASDSTSLANSYHNLGMVYELLDSLELALDYYALSFELNKKLKNRNYYLGSNLDNMGIVYKKMGQYIKARECSFQALNHFEIEYDRETMAFTFDNIGDTYILENNTDSALFYYQLAIDNVVAEYQSASLYENPQIDREMITDKKGLYIYLSSKANALQIKYEGSKNILYLNTAFDAYLKLDSLADIMRLEYRSDASKESLVKNTKPVYDEAIALCHQLYELSGNITYAYHAFEFAEKSKSIILLEGVRKLEAKTLIDEKLAEEERDLNLKKNYYEKEIAFSNMENLDLKSKKTILDSLSKYRTAHNQKINEIVNRYPSYEKLKNNTEIVNISSIMDSMLSADDTFIEFHEGKNKLYAFIADINSFVFIEMPVDLAIREQIKQFNQSILNKKTGDYVKLAHSLYLKLIDPLKKQTVLGKHLFIVPDGALTYLSFDALLRVMPEKTNVHAFRSHDYLIRDHQITYNYSATLWKEMLKPVESNTTLKHFCAFAPAFPEAFPLSVIGESKVTHQLGALVLNIEEANQISTRMKGKLFKKGKANIEKFRLVAPTYRIIHLATHAKANDEDGDYSFIVFTGKKKNDYEYLFARDLYSMQLKADLVVLSACETNMGEMMKGEGLISLSRSFTYAGSKSLLATLWIASEKASSDICTNFYNLLNQNKNKAQALQGAKLKYIKDQDMQRKAHPFYWAGYSLIGNSDPITID